MPVSYIKTAVCEIFWIVQHEEVFFILKKIVFGDNIGETHEYSFK